SLKIYTVAMRNGPSVTRKGHIVTFDRPDQPAVAVALYKTYNGYNADHQEAVFVMRAADNNGAAVQIMMHSDKIVIRRDRELGWSGIIVEDHQIQMNVDGTVIRVDLNGGVVVERDFQKTHRVLETMRSISKMA
ncbi:MAG: hypothetical protein KKB02_12175, partial [Alphaproteobacteria bacterium]|nr:hypothetical protein [Alphaproteobacteria bacterium]